MVELIKQHKDRVLDYIGRELDKYGKDRMDVESMYKLADIVKDLAEAEKECWEAEYYRAVTEAMEGGSMGYTTGMMPMGYGQARDSMGRYARRGYHDGQGDVLQQLKRAMADAEPQRRDEMARELRTMIGM